MKKLLIACLGLFFCCQSPASAAVREVSSPESATIESNNIPAPSVTVSSPLDRFETESDFKRYLIERLKSVAITKYDKNSGSFGGSATSVVEDKIPGVTVEKPFFDRIYEEAIKRSAEISTEPASEQLHPRILQPELRQKQQEETDQLPMLSILLPPFDEKVSVPPFEHIPYLFTRIAVLPDGLVKFDETIMVVANNQKLRYPLAKALPTYMVDRNGNGHKIEASLIGVTINDQPVAYKISERGGDTLIMPETVFPLESGVYKYVFSYVIDRQTLTNCAGTSAAVTGIWLSAEPAPRLRCRPTPKPWGSRFWLAIRSIILPKKRLLPGSPKTSWDLRLKNRCSLPRECRLRLLFPKALSANRILQNR